MTQPPAIAAAHALLLRLAGLGVRHFVLAPGSRSAPLAYALAAASEGGLIDLHVRIDERSAGFLALGLSTDGPYDRRPVGIVTTSGTAVANLHPAVVEAHHVGAPLIVLSADRPAELRNSGANQTTEQVGIFGGSLRFAYDAPAPDGRVGEIPGLLAQATRMVAAATGQLTGNPGPVQLNLQFRPPLVPALPLEPITVSQLETVDHFQPRFGRMTEVPRALDEGEGTDGTGDAGTGEVIARRTVVVAGHGVPRGLGLLARRRAWPVFAEPTAHVDGLSNAIAGYPLLLASPLAERIEEVVVLGRPTLSRPVQTLLARTDVRVTVIATPGKPWPDPAGNAARVLPRIPARWMSDHAHLEEAVAWRDEWLAAGSVVAQAIRDVTAGPALDGLTIARSVVSACGADDVLLVGSSSPIRDLDLVLDIDQRDQGLPQIYANRGVAGIDGTVSTALGIARAGGAGPAHRARALVGDLTFLHDAGGLLRGPHEPQIDLQIIVVNDDGGSIFSTLEPGALARSSAQAAATFDRVFATPHDVALAAICAAYGAKHERVVNVRELSTALQRNHRGVHVIEAVTNQGRRRGANLDLDERLRAVLGK